MTSVSTSGGAGSSGGGAGGNRGGAGSSSAAGGGGGNSGSPAANDAAADAAMIEEVIKRRLLIDGDGCGDDRRIMALSRSVMNFCRKEETPAETDLAFRRMMAQLNQVKYDVKRTHQSIRVNQRTKASYKDFGEKIVQEIDKTKKQISDSKVVLQEATKLRKCSMEYDALAKLIQTKPDRKKTEEKCAKLKSEYEQYDAKKKILDNKLAQRRLTAALMTSEVKKLKDFTETHEVFQGLDLDENGEDDSKVPLPGTSAKTNGISKTSGSDQSEAGSPMDIATQMMVPLESNNDGDLSQLNSPDENICGIVTSAPLTPVEKSLLENYEDLSEEENGVEDMIGDEL